jgi:hypothetical protein
MFDQKYLPIKESRKYFNENNLDTDIFDIKINEIKEHMNKIYGIIGDKKARGIYKGLIIIRMEEYNLLNGFILKYWKYGNTDDGKIRIQKYKKMYYEYEEKMKKGYNYIFENL